MLSSRFVLFALALTTTSCVLRDVVALKPDAKKIKLVREADKPVNCEPVADISGTSRAQDEKEARKGAENDMRNKASQYDANFAVVEIERAKAAGTGPYREVFMSGKAMKCVTFEMEEQQEKAEAERKEREEREAAEKARQEELDRAREEEEKQEKEKEDEADDDE